MKIYLKNEYGEWQLYKGKKAKNRMLENWVELGDSVKLGYGVKQ